MTEEAKRCPECGVIVRGDSEICGNCGADLWRVPEKPLEEAVQEEENVEAAATDELRKEDRANARRRIKELLAVYVVTAVLIVSGFLLVEYSRPSGLVSLTPFSLGFLLIWVSFLMLLYGVIGVGPSGRGRRWPWT